MNGHGWRKYTFCGGTILVTSALFAWFNLPAPVWQAVVIACVIGYVGGNVGSKFSKEAGAWASSSTPNSLSAPPSSQP